jgi:RNA 2',3'-cyclic 3'-phosphodiesterase
MAARLVVPVLNIDMRLFVALDIDDPIGERIQRFLDGVQGFAPDVRWVKPESLHVTLKFIGEKPTGMVDKIRASLGNVHSEAFELSFRSYGFFPTARAPRVFWIGIEAGPQLKSLAASVDSAMGVLGVPKEDHGFSPHLTLARGSKSGAPRWQKGDGPHSKFKILQEKLGAMGSPEFGTMTAREFFLYESKLSPSGSKYSKLEKFALNDALS